MWDAWAAYDARARGYIDTEKRSAADVAAAQNEAISYAAWTVLTSRFENAVGGEDSLLQFDEVLTSLCYDPTKAQFLGNTPSAVGNRIGRAVLAFGLADGANEAGGYKAPAYVPVNAPLVVASLKKFSMVDPNRWQPLEIIQGFSQNGIPTGTTQVGIDPHWGHVMAFGVTDTTLGVPLDPGPPPRLGDPATDAALKAMVVEIIRDSSLLDGNVATIIDASPASRGGNPLGSNAGAGYSVNPVTGRPYAPKPVRASDFFRVMAEFWADGPRSETPPGHWNVIANDASDRIAIRGRPLVIAGHGAPVGRLEWDVKLYLGLNGAVHNAAIVAWALKGKYDTVRPISLIRYMGGLGQSSNPNLASYNRRGLPLVKGLIEVVTAASSAAGQRHHALAGYVGRVAVRAWGGNPDDPSSEIGGTKWMLATAWVPYQLSTFVTPSFAAYASGHSTFSRAAAEVLTAFTGSMYFPGGLASYGVLKDGLQFEHGPTGDVDLEWATYYDAADQAGQSRLFGGIHIQADDFTGRRMGSACGRAAWHLATEYFGGTVVAGEPACVTPIRGDVN
jgi:hypothetical protein